MTYRIVEDQDDAVTYWVCEGLKEDTSWLGKHLTFGFVVDDKIIGGLIFHSYRPNKDVWWTVYTTDKRWCNRRMLRHMFAVAFDVLKCERINILISASNEKSLQFTQKLGFQKEGLLRKYRENGEDCYILGMLRSECKWI